MTDYCQAMTKPERMTRTGDGRDPRMDLIAVIYRLHGAMRSLFAGPPSGVKMVLLEALVLGAIVHDAEPPTVSQIGRELGYSRQSVQRAVNKLVEVGLVERQENPRHKRAPIFVPTTAGVVRMHEVQRCSRELAEYLSAAFPDKRSNKLLGELRDLAAGIDTYAKARGRF